MRKLPTPRIEVTRHVRLPNRRDTDVSMFGLRWKDHEVEFGCATYTPEVPSNQSNDHYEMMTIQHIIDEYIKWAQTWIDDEMCGDHDRCEHEKDKR